MSNAGIERCEAAVCAALEAIQTAAGYRTDVGKVYRVPLNADQLPAGANMVVMPAPDGMTFDDDTPSGTVKTTNRLIVAGVLKFATADTFDSERATRLNLFLEDALDALLTDPDFGFPHLVDSRLEVGDRDIDADRGFGYFSIRLHLTYHFARGTMR